MSSLFKRNKSAGSSSSPYEQLQDDQFRVLRIDSIVNGQITCTLTRHQISHAPPYRALSYVWNNDKNASISLNGHHLAVSADLHLAIHKIYSFQQQAAAANPANNVAHIWIDAICINQSSSKEREKQVLLMGSIYQQAVSVLLWFGPEQNNSSVVLSSMSRYLQALDAYADRVSPNKLPAEFRQARHQQDIEKFFERKWWFRVWIVQEAILAQHIHVLCGDAVVEWETLIEFVALYTRVTTGSFSVGLNGMLEKDGSGRKTGAMMALEFDMLRKSGMPLQGWTIIDAYNTTRANGCTEPVDRVWALAGLLPQRFRQHIKDVDMVDYSDKGKKNYTVTWIRFAKMLITLDVEMGCLLLSTTPSHKRLTGLPSWCPDWSSEPTSLSLAIHHSFAAGTHPRPREAHENTTKQAKQIGKFSGSVQQIQLAGFVADTIGLTSAALGNFPKSLVSLAENDRRRTASIILGWLSTCLPFMNHGQQSFHNTGLDALREAPAYVYESMFGVASRTHRDATMASQADYQAWLDLLRAWSNGHTKMSNMDGGEWARFARIQNFHERVWMTCRGRRLCAFHNQRFGVVDGGAKVGDLAVIVHGAKSVLVLRPSPKNGPQPSNGDRFELIGECYMYGAMSGEEYLLPPDRRGVERLFVIE